MRFAALRLVPWITLTFLVSACGDSETSPTNGGDASAGTPVIAITAPEDGESITAVGDRVDVTLEFELSDSLSDDVVDCLLDDVSAGLADGSTCSFADVGLGEHALGVAVLQANGTAYENEGARASVSVTVSGTACTSAADCDDSNDCSLDACEGGTCAYYASPIEGCDSDFSTYQCKEDSDCAQFLEGQGSCASAVCDGGENVCYVTVLAEGDSCDDGDTCTTGDQCDASGNCVGGGPADCDDGNACTTEECVAGEGCKYTDVICDDGDICTTDSCGEEGCVFEVSDGPCDDGDLCTIDDVCTDGQCTGLPKDCADEDLCTQEKCDEETGECIADPVADVTVCDDENPCTTDACTGDGGCEFTNNNAATCEDGELCTVGDSCFDGACVPGAFKVCDDGDGCNGIETCDIATGECAPGAPILCDDDDACTTDACDAGFCVHNPIPNCCAEDSECDNGDPCDGVETCVEGFCAAGTPATCGDNNLDSACGEECDDGNNEPNDGCSAVCSTEIPECQTDQMCDDQNPCTDDICDTSNGLNKCIYSNNANSCDDGDECTVSDNCLEGICTGAPKDCEDGVDCTINTCDSTLGCQTAEDDSKCVADECKLAFCEAGAGCVQEPDPAPNVPCAGDACTTNGVCQLGSCIGDPVDCEDGDTCTSLECNPQTGCTYSPETNKVCNDGNACTEDDVCGATEGGVAQCLGTPIAGCGEEGVVCTLQGASGTEVSCFLGIARSSADEEYALGLQFGMDYDGSKLQLVNFYDEFCFMGICNEVFLSGPGAGSLGTGHTMTTIPSATGDWDGSGIAIFSKFGAGTCEDASGNIGSSCYSPFQCNEAAGETCKNASIFSDAYVDSNGDVQGDATFVEVRFTLLQSISGAAAANVTLSNVEAAWDSGQDMLESFNGNVIVTTPLY